MEKTNKPIYKIKVGSIDGAIWEQKGKEGNFLTISIHRNYKDKEGNWQQTNNLRVNDLPAMKIIMDECYKYAKIRSIDQER